MKVQNALNQVQRFNHVFKEKFPVLSFDCKIAETWNGPFKTWSKKEVPGDGLSQQSGVYIFSDDESNILYIGKAASNNLGAEIYSKFRTSTGVDSNNSPLFKNSPMSRWAPKEYKNQFIQGNIHISAVTVEPKEFSSLLEVFFHVWCFKIEKLPPLNKQIG